MGINDWGAAGERLNSPALGGPGGWAAAVAAALNGDDTTVDARIAEAVAGLARRVFSPSGTGEDVCVQVWNDGTGGREPAGWQTVHYDSGWRNIESLLVNGWTVSGQAYLRRVNDRVEVELQSVNGSAATSGALMVPPTGFEPTVITNAVIGTSTSAFPSLIVTRTAVSIQVGGAYTGVTSGRLHMEWSTPNPIPTTLPGTLVSPAPTGTEVATAPEEPQP